MLIHLDELHNYTLRAKDDDIGRVKDFYIDDHLWQVRYMVADTHKWLPGRKVLISPASIDPPDVDGRRLPVNLTTRQIKDSPEIHEETTVSRQEESVLAEHYGWPMYWSSMGIPAAGYAPIGVRPYPNTTDLRPEPAQERLEQPRLRSLREVLGYHLQAKDDEIGHAEDFIVDTDDWRIRYMIVDTRNWWPGKKVLVAVHWIESIRWSEKRIYVDLTRDRIKNGPEYDPDRPVDRAYEKDLHRHHDRQPYWDQQSV